MEKPSPDSVRRTSPTIPASASGSARLEGPLPQSATSRPFLSARTALQDAGYVEEEYVLSGPAHVYEWVGNTRDVKIVAGPATYHTRILVWRPREPQSFSGNVELTLLNASFGYDLEGPLDPDGLVARGDVWVGLTTKPVAANALKRWDPARYARLNWPSPVPPDCRCDVPSIIPVYTYGADGPERVRSMGHKFSSRETEDGLIWDILDQLGQLLKGEGRHALLPGFQRPALYMVGFSQSAQYLRTWLVAFHDRFRAADGTPLYDGYLGIGGPVLIRLNQCSADVLPGDPRQIPAVSDARYISLVSEGEVWMTRHNRHPDLVTDTHGMLSYEVAGAAHIYHDLPGVPPSPFASQTPVTPAMEATPARSTLEAMTALLPPGTALNNLPWKPVVRGALQNLQRWVRDQKAPPQSVPIELDTTGDIRRDANGNALGGVRLPQIAVPLQTYRGFLHAGGLGSVMGWRRPFPRDLVRSRFPTRDVYLMQFSDATDRLLDQGWISASDAAAMKASAGPEFDSRR